MTWGGDPENIKLSTVSTTGPHVLEGLMLEFPRQCALCELDGGDQVRAAIKFPAGKVGWITDISATRDWL